MCHMSCKPRFQLTKTPTKMFPYFSQDLHRELAINKTRMSIMQRKILIGFYFFKKINSFHIIKKKNIQKIYIQQHPDLGLTYEFKTVDYFY